MVIGRVGKFCAAAGRANAATANKRAAARYHDVGDMKDPRADSAHSALQPGDHLAIVGRSPMPAKGAASCSGGAAPKGAPPRCRNPLGSGEEQGLDEWRRRAAIRQRRYLFWPAWQTFPISKGCAS